MYFATVECRIVNNFDKVNFAKVPFKNIFASDTKPKKFSTMEIQQIKTQLSILQVLTSYNLTPDKNNRLRCPFHNDKTPSMQVYPDTNTVYCFSSKCKLHGKAIDQIDFIMHKEETTKHKALKKAAEMAGEEPVTKTIKSMKTKTSNTQVNYNELFPLLKQSLHRSKAASNYLKSRHIYDIKAEIGYNPTGGLRTEEAKNFKGMRNCIIFPLKDKENNIVSLYGRSITNNTTSKHYYTANRTGLYPEYPKPETKTLILTESIIDATTLIQNRKDKACLVSTAETAILACYGTNGLQEEHMQAVKKLKNLKEIIFFFDGDDAGQTASKKHAQTLKQLPAADCRLSTVPTPENEDINSLLDGHEQEIFTHLINNRIEFFSSNELSSEKKSKVQTQFIASHPEEPKVLPTGNCRLHTENPDYITFQTENLLISILGGIALHPLDKLRTTLKIQRSDSNSPLHSIRHSLDLYHDDQAEKLIRKAAERLETGTKPMQLAIAELTEALEEYREKQVKAQKPPEAKKRILTETRKTKALNYLKSPGLLKRTGQDIAKTGVVGEEKNSLLMYLIFTSRLREQPLHIITLGASGTGKTYLQEKISELIPEEDKIEITALSENALYYFERKELKHKLILIEDLDGAQDDKILFAVRELMSKRKISKTIPIKDSKGNLKTVHLTVEGPICLAATTTREKLYEDNANRSILIYSDNSKQQKEHIMNYQRKLSAGSINKKKEEELKEFFKDMQSILRPVRVRNPYAELLKIPESVFKPLRTNAHYLAFIETVTFYHQWQRELKTNPETGEIFIETTLEDIEQANDLLKDVLLAKRDELTNACRRFFEKLKTKLQKDKKESFYRSEIREMIQINPHNLRHYLSQLTTFGYLKIIGGNKYKTGYEYEITRKDEFTKLNQSIENALDTALNKVKEALQNQKNKACIERSRNAANVTNSCESAQLATQHTDYQSL